MNNNLKWIAVVTVAVIAGAALGYGFAHRGSSGAAQSGQPTGPEAGSGQTEAERKVLYWHDPMVPGARFDQPGKSPFMDMQLVPVYSDDAGGGDVRISPNVTQNLGIRLGKVAKRTLTHPFNTVGSVTFDERLLEIVQARVSGNVTRLYVKAPLERVRRGQPLAEVLAPEWLAAQQDYLALLEVQSASAQAIREAARQRLVVLGVPEATIRTLEQDGRTNPTTTVFAPIDGVVTELGVRTGSAFAAGDSLVRINGLATAWVNAQVPETQISLVTTGSGVEVQASAWPGIIFKARVIALLPQVDLQTRTLTVRLAVENPDYRLSPGMFVSLSFTGSAAQQQLVVPSEAVIATGKRSVVIVARGDGAFDVTDVVVGMESNGMSTVLSGLAEGQSVVLSGQFLIDSEASLRSTTDRLTGAQP